MVSTAALPDVDARSFIEDEEQEQDAYACAEYPCHGPPFSYLASVDSPNRTQRQHGCRRDSAGRCAAVSSRSRLRDIMTVGRGGG